MVQNALTDPPAPIIAGLPDDAIRIFNLCLIAAVVVMMLRLLIPRMNPKAVDRYTGPEALARIGFIGVLLASAYATLELLFGWPRSFRLVGLTVSLLWLAVAYARITYDDWRSKHPRKPRRR